MNLLRNYFLFAFFLTSVLAVWASDAPQLPTIISPFYDEVGIVDEAQKNSIEERLRIWSQSNKVQIQIVILNNLQEVSIEEFSIKLASHYQWGEKGKDNGILFLMSLKERKMRIEVGKGLEGAITDAHSSRMIRELRTYFQSKNFYEGFIFLTNNLYSLVLKEFPDDDLAKQEPSKERGSGHSKIFYIIFFIVFIIFSFFQRLFPSNSYRTRRSTGWHSGTGGWGGGGSSGSGGWSGGGGGFSGGGASGDW